MERDGCVFVRVVGIRRRPTMGIERRKGKAFPQFPAWEDGTPNSLPFLPDIRVFAIPANKRRGCTINPAQPFWGFFLLVNCPALSLLLPLSALLFFFIRAAVRHLC